MKLIIFDLDHTLVDLIPAHDEATRELFRQEFGIDARLTDIDYSGKSMIENFMELGKLKKIAPEEIEKASTHLLTKYEKLFERKIPSDPESYLLRGVPELLRRLSETGNLLGLYTGDTPGIVDAVLKASGIGKYFAVTVTSTEAESRTGMAGLLVQKAQQLSGKSFEGRNVIIIGDSVRDVETGKDLHAVTIAVATGSHSRGDLWKRAPDYLFDDLGDFGKVLEAIESS